MHPPTAFRSVFAADILSMSLNHVEYSTPARAIRLAAECRQLRATAGALGRFATDSLLRALFSDGIHPVEILGR